MKRRFQNALKLVFLFMGLLLLTVSSSYGQKKHWSHRKKDAVIGGAAGAGVGAAVSHKRGKGALIGGAIGATAGYLHGKSKDKKGQ